ncbi:MAG: tyrosine--tRNA ligase, partial [Chloroflexi bacterium]|nr:tyrosine--tRNA ligase [Chloroflexota bacterium]
MDPTAPDIHLGHTVVLGKLRQFQDLGHKGVLIIGDYTAMVGDPSGRNATRPMLSPEQIKANAQTYLDQAGKVLDLSPDKLEVRSNSEWLAKMNFADVLRLASKKTVARMLERDTFEKRFKAEQEIGIHELLYPLMQGWDSVCIEADVELGGTDQTFNNLVGRDLQKIEGQQPQVVMIMPLLVGLDGTQKMSQSLGNFIAIDDPPHDMYGKLMSIPDTLIADYFELLTDVPDDELTSIRKAVEKRSANPMDHKMRLARDIVAQFHSDAAAVDSEEDFVRTFRKRELPEEAIEVPLSALPKAKISPSSREAGIQTYDLGSAIHTYGLASSLSEARRLIKQGAVEINGRKIASNLNPLEPGMVIRVGKHRFLRIVDAGG